MKMKENTRLEERKNTGRKKEQKELQTTKVSCHAVGKKRYYTRTTWFPCE